MCMCVLLVEALLCFDAQIDGLRWICACVLCFFHTHKLRMEVEVDLSLNDLGCTRPLDRIRWTDVAEFLCVPLCRIRRRLRWL